MKLDEKFGSGLVRVLKKVQRNGKTVKQAFHVRQASPGDQYATSAGLPQPAKPSSPQAVPVAPVDDGSVAPEAQAEAPGPMTRVTVKFSAIPWRIDGLSNEPDDPIPDAVRKRFAKGSKAVAAAPLDVAGVPSITVASTDPVSWGTGEPDLLMALISGNIKKMRLIGGGNGLMVAKIESNGGGSFHAFMWMEALRSPLIGQLWGDVLDLSSDDGSLSRRAACAYETAKACGLDDLTPPTVHRMDSDGDVMSMLPDSLIEQSFKTEWIASQTGKNQEVVINQLGKHASLQFIRGDLRPIESEPWFRNLFGSSNVESMSDIWAQMPPGIRSSFIRTALFDFIIGNLDRSFGDMAFSDDPRHPMMIFGSELSMPCPRTIGLAYGLGGYGPYVDTSGSAPGAIPLLWSDPLTMLAVRGGTREVSDFETAGIAVAKRMRDDRPVELIRSLVDHKITPLQMAGVLSRIWMLETFSKDIARDPYIPARYYASIIDGNPDPGMDGVRDFVNNTMSKGVAGGFDFYSEMKMEADDEGTP